MGDEKQKGMNNLKLNDAELSLVIEAINVVGVKMSMVEVAVSLKNKLMAKANEMRTRIGSRNTTLGYDIDISDKQDDEK